MSCLTRGTLTYVFQAALEEDPRGWDAGPIPFSYGGVSADGDTRRNYFSFEAGLALYGHEKSATRWHRLLDDQWSSCRITGLELLRVPNSIGRRALAVVHTELPPDELLERAVAASCKPAGRGTAGNSDFESLFGGSAVLFPDSFTVAFRTFEDSDPPLPSGNYRGVTAPAAELWSWCLASRSTSFDYPPEPGVLAKLFSEAIVLSADWKALVLRDGASFVGQRADLGPTDPFFGFAALYVRTIYLDCILLGMAQRTQIEGMAATIAGTLSAGNLTRNLQSLEADLVRFRNLWWMRRVSSHDIANEVLRHYQDRHGMVHRFEAVATQISELSRIVQTRDSRQSTAALGALTVVGLPLGTALSVLQVLDIRGLVALLVGALSALAAAAVLLVTPFGRVICRTFRDLSGL